MAGFLLSFYKSPDIHLDPFRDQITTTKFIIAILSVLNYSNRFEGVTHMTKFLVAVMISTVALACPVQDDGAKEKSKLAGIKCVVMGKQAKKDFAVKYKEGEVYLCCSKCVTAFEKDPTKFATKSNHQLAASGQYVQKKCPMSGQALAEGIVSKVGGVEVGFCCGDCKKSVDDASDLAAKSKLVFADKPFAKGFEKKQSMDLAKVKCLMMPKRSVKAEHAVDYLGGKVFFCCKGCKSKFAKDQSKYEVLANQQLVSTGQFVQKACPISGSDVDSEYCVEINGNKICFCCDRCEGQVKKAADSTAQAEIVFSADRFKKGFEKK